MPSKQYMQQEKNIKEGKCSCCREPLFTKRHCKRCAEKVRTLARNAYRKKAGIPLEAPLRKAGRNKTQDNEEMICRKVAKFYEGKDWHRLSLEEREIVGDLVQAGWLSENRPANGFVGKTST
jgi:hypothetical protein